MAEFPTNGERRALLEFRAKCEQAFTPFAPSDLPEFFAGRTEAVRRVESEIAAPGRHVAIFGERGVGKTSLAQLASFFLRRSEKETHFIRCERSSTFDAIFADVLTSAGVEALLEGVESESQRQGGLNVPGSFMPGLRSRAPSVGTSANWWTTPGAASFPKCATGTTSSPTR